MLDATLTQMNGVPSFERIEVNKYTATGIALDSAVNQKRIIVVVPREQERRQALHMFASLDLMSEESAMIRRANGSERIDFHTGGAIIFKSARQTTRGYVADVIYVEEDVVRHTLNAEQWERWQFESLPSLIQGGGQLIIGT